MHGKPKKKINIETGIPGGPRLVGRRLPGVSVGDAGKMLLGQDVPEEVVQQAAQGSESNHLDMAGHIPTIGALVSVEGGWGVFCLRCSGDAQEYVYPCLIDPDGWPPEVLVAYEVTEQ